MVPAKLLVRVKECITTVYEAALRWRGELKLLRWDRERHEHIPGIIIAVENEFLF